MFIAHLPAGYLIGKALRQSRAVLAAAMVGAVSPDLDMAYFYLVDGARTHHHDYVTHWPLFWGGVGLGLLLIAPLLSLGARRVALSSLLGVASHMALDSVAAPINWLAPVGDFRVELFPIPAAYSHWILSFVLHWTFAIELAICGLALAVRWRGQQKTPD